MAYLHSESITINHTLCGSSDSTNFPMLFNSTITNLKTTGNGGEVINSSGFDIIFSSQPNDFLGLNKLDFEIERYTATSGEYIAWVRVPTVSSSTNTVIYLYWGNALISTSQENINGVWDTNYKGVWHLPDGTSLTLNDSTSNANNLTNVASTPATSGKIDGAASFNGSTQTLTKTSNASLQISGNMTISCWMNNTNSTGFPVAISKASGLTRNYELGFENTTNVPRFVVTQGSGNYKVADAGTTTVGTLAYLVGVYDGAHLTVYVNGAASGTPLAVSGAIDTSTDAFAIGSLQSSPTGQWFTGSIDEARVSATNRVADWITTEYNNQSNPGTFYTLGTEINNSGISLLSILNAG